MKVWMLAISFVLLLFRDVYPQSVEKNPESFFIQSIEEECLNIQSTSANDYNKLSDLYAGRGEDLLILGEDDKALEDFLLSYEYALKCRESENKDLLAFRPLLGAFLVYVRSENLALVQETSKHLQSILKNYECKEYSEQRSYAKKYCSTMRSMPLAYHENRPDYPILGPEEISISECLGRVKTIAIAIRALLTRVQDIGVILCADILIDQLIDTAGNCCRAGGLWKGCLQKLANKLHYWKAFGVPADPAWD